MQQAPPLSAGLIGKGKLERYPFLGSRDSGDVALARRVLDQLDVARSHGDLFPTRHFELAITAQSNYVLAAGSSVPVADSTGRGPMQFSSGCHHHLEDIIASPRSEFGVYLFGTCWPSGPV